MAYNTEDEIKRQYAKEAADYRKDALKVNYEFDEFWKYLKEIIDGIFRNHQYPLKVLDLGAGTGMLSERLLQEYPNAHITMLDFSPEMLAQGEAYFNEQGLDNGHIERVLGNFITDPIPGGPYDLIISSYALHHVRTPEDLECVYKKIASALHEKYGTFFCIDYYLGNNEEEQKKQVEALRNKLREHFPEDKVKLWLDLIRAEDTPATRYQTYRAISGAYRLLGRTGEMSAIYGMTKLLWNQMFYGNLGTMFRRYQNEFPYVGACEEKIGPYPELPEDNVTTRKKERK